MSLSPAQVDGRGSLRGITVASEGHARLFFHDKELIDCSRRKSQALEDRVADLEKLLDESMKTSANAREKLKASESGKYDAEQLQIVIERHLELSKFRYNELSQNYNIVYQTMGNLNQRNAVLSQQVDSCQKTIASMAQKISECEGTAQKAPSPFTAGSNYEAKEESGIATKRSLEPEGGLKKGTKRRSRPKLRVDV